MNWILTNLNMKHLLSIGNGTLARHSALWTLNRYGINLTKIILNKLTMGHIFLKGSQVCLAVISDGEPWEAGSASKSYIIHLFICSSVHPFFRADLNSNAYILAFLSTIILKFLPDASLGMLHIYNSQNSSQ